MDKRDSLKAQLEIYRRAFPGETGTVNRFESLLEIPECAERTCYPGHLTGSGWLMNSAGDSVLLTHHAKLDLWLQLGGHADGNWDILGVARREVEEESGLTQFELESVEIFDIDVHRIPARGSEPEHYHYDIRYAFRMQSAADQFVVSNESHDLSWVPVEAMDQYNNEASMIRMRDKWFLLGKD
jgi:8-oxo-dGTP pyrophosphatase MutT (NUDIX family)